EDHDPRRRLERDGEGLALLEPVCGSGGPAQRLECRIPALWVAGPCRHVLLVVSRTVQRVAVTIEEGHSQDAMTLGVAPQEFLVGLRSDGSCPAALRNGRGCARVDGCRVSRSVVGRASVLSGGATEGRSEDVIEETLAHQLVGDDPCGFVLL